MTFSAWLLIPATLLFRQATRASATWFLDSRPPISASLTAEPEAGLEIGSSSRKLSSLNWQEDAKSFDDSQVF
jgi:hypothetical protein